LAVSKLPLTELWKSILPQPVATSTMVPVSSMYASQERWMLSASHQMADPLLEGWFLRDGSMGPTTAVVSRM
jgi:hypothetical protein